MGQVTGISWTRSTRNAWSGCTKVGPGCDGCYAEAFQRWIRGKNPATGEATNWGPGAPRIPHLEGFVRDLRKWDRIAAWEKEHGTIHPSEKGGWNQPGFYPVFINSHSDTFDGDVIQDWRDVVFQTIEACPNLTLQLVTKRVGNVARMVPAHWLTDGFPPNVWLIITAVTQAELDRDMPKLLALRGVRVRGLSLEPLIEKVDLDSWLKIAAGGGIRDEIWGIIGGESDQAGHETRAFDPNWALSAVAQLHSYGYAAFVKQLGSRPQEISYPENVSKEEEKRWWASGWTKITMGDDSRPPHWRRYLKLKDDHGADPAEWPEALRHQEFPRLAPTLRGEP